MVDIFLLILFKASIDLVLYNYIIPIYGNDPYLSFGSLSLPKLIISYVLMISIWPCLKVITRDDSPISILVLYFQTVILIIPSLSLSAQELRPLSDALYISLSVLITGLLVHILPKISFPKLPVISIYGIPICGLLISLYVMGGLFFANSSINFDFYKVYSIRSELHEKYLPLYGYLIPWFGNIINITIMLYGFLKHKYSIILIALAIQLLLFGVTNFKSFLFLPFVIAGYVIVRKKISVMRTFILGGLCFINILLLIYYSGEPMGLGIINRALIIPAALSSLYFEYFSLHDYAFMFGSKLGSLFESSYDTNAIYVIAQEYWGQIFSPNVAWMVDAYANLGVPGMLMSIFILSIILKVADSFAVRISQPQIAEALFISIGLVLCSSSLPTALLTHGGLISVIALYWLVYIDGNKDHNYSKVTTRGSIAKCV